MTIQQIYGIANLLEGEGTFLHDKTTPKIRLKMTDEDIVAKARNLMSPNSKIGIVPPANERCKTAYYFSIQGSIAIQWMMTIYSLMGRRRKERIREVIQVWKGMTKRRQKGTDYCIKGHPLLIEGEQFQYRINYTGSQSKVCLVCEKSYREEHREEKNRKQKLRKPKLEAIKAVAMSRNVTMEEAEKMLDGFLNKTVN